MYAWEFHNTFSTRKQTTIQDKIKFKLDASYQILMNDYALNMQFFERWMRLQFN